MGIVSKGRRVLSEQVDSLRVRAEASVKLLHRTGMLQAMTVRSLVGLAKVALSKSQNPSRYYSVHAKTLPHRPALVWRGETTTWAELEDRIDRLSAGLLRCGVGPRERVILMMRNRPELVELTAASARGGAAAVTISWRSTAEELAYLAEHSGARALVTEPELLGIVEKASEKLSAPLRSNVFVTTRGSSSISGAPSGLSVRPFEALLQTRSVRRKAVEDEDAAVVVYTSGTTGKPKGAVRKFPKDTSLAGMQFINETPMRVDDVHLVTCPLYHSTAFGFLTFTHVLGGTAVILDEFKPEEFLAAIERHRVTTTAVVPTMLHRVMQLPEDVRRRYDTRSFRAVFSGGAPLPGPLAIDFMNAFGDVLFNFYGATETGLVTLAKPTDLRAAPGTIGPAIPGSEIRLLDEARRDVRPGEVGELFVKNNLLVSGYHGDDAATRASLVEGYFSVGDLARSDAGGRFFIEGRKRDMIISGGVNVYPAEVEAVLEQHPDVSEVAVVGVVDREWGERVCAFVVPGDVSRFDEAALLAFARAKLSGPKVPRSIVVLEALPRNPTGKVLKRELREQFQDRNT
jgi:fatty-acyl-CoA synthase